MRINRWLILAIVGLIWALPYKGMAALDDVVMDATSQELMKGIDEESRRHAIYSYNIANAATPGFRPIHIEGDDRIGGITMDSMQNEVVLDAELGKLTKARLRHSALNKLLSTKMQISKRIFTFGKQ